MGRTITSDNDAYKAPVGTVVFLYDNGGAMVNRRVVAQKHEHGWFIASDWEDACEDRDIRGKVLVWGTKH